jgi:LacI family transcriptional regulator
MTSPTNETRKRPATIVDVARLAGVAIGTVSRHLNGQSVRAGNRDQIEQAIAALGYRRNSTAVAMKTNTSRIVGFLVPSLGEFHAAMLEQLSRQMRLSGRAVLSFCHNLQPASIREALEFFATHRVDALVMDGDETARQELLRHVDDGLVVVLYDNDIPDLPADRVFVDNRKASARAVSHLLDLGHRRISVIHGSQRDSAGRERLQGYHDAFAVHGLTPDPSLIMDGQWLETRGYDCMRSLLSLAEPPTAVFIANYNMTLGALAHLHEAGIEIPRDLSLVSFDDVPALRLHNPAITAIGQPIAEIAQAIAGIVEARLANPAAMGRQNMRIDCGITLRDSTRPLK